MRRLVRDAILMAFFGVCLVGRVVAAEGVPVVVGEQPQAPTALPPAGSAPVFTTIELRFPTQGNVASVEFQTYLYYMEIDDYVSLPSQGRWTPFD
ncbi:MAG: hypothetical protein VX453_16145, partial [Acidobacteriota bacterium]|nr:hypothetical protein [Acidobacteriota bacterium]